MPDQRRHRGPHPEDSQLFSSTQIPELRSAVGDLSWLLSRGYAATSSLKLVGDRYKLAARQRAAVARCACTDEQRCIRQEKCLPANSVSDRELWLDGYNVLTSIEAALSGGVLLRGRDQCIRDMASMHGSYRKVAETVPAIELIGNALVAWEVSHCRWLLDQPVSNSGRLRAMLVESAETQHWNWDVELVPDPDPILAEAKACIATADSEILNQTGSWVNLVGWIVESELPDAWLVDLSDSEMSVDDQMHQGI